MITINILKQENNQLKKETEKLQHQLEVFTRQLENANKEVINEKEKGATERQKNEQKLVRIKEIAEENIRIADLEGLNGVYRRGLAKQILQIIEEEI